MFHIGDALIRIRDERRITQAQLAAMAHMRPNTLGDLENNKKKSRIETLEKVVAALGMSVPDLYRKLDELKGLARSEPALIADSERLCSNPEHAEFQRMVDFVLESPVTYEVGSRKIFVRDGITINIVSHYEKVLSLTPAPEGDEPPFAPPSDYRISVEDVARRLRESRKKKSRSG